ncbi:Tryprostatin B 6-hydroxylase [Madurella mycetomatis]|uniref:Tryprostatin B 6-hydroxylase n=1 Tax=Madurella mycetomatis TaxID=100816 RepID=A0A175VQF1_9PEZI|nr:Tryprostatin B 6-hydroxylase [Madurella mycetomatis]
MSFHYLVSSHELFWLVGFLSGVAVHQSLFIRGEWHYLAPNIACCYGLLAAGSTLVRILFDDPVTGQALAFHVLGLAVSVLVYRLFFHRLNRTEFPGPWCARLSKLGHVWQCRDSKNHLYLHRLNAKYGDFVRTGPAEVTVFVPEAVQAVSGRQSDCIKAEFYDLLWPERALFAARDKSVHASRRRDWQLGFSPRAIPHHEKKVLRHIDELSRQLELKARSGTVVNATDFFLWFTFDVMGDFTFSKSFGMLESQRWHDIILKTKNARVLLGPLTPTPWLLHLGIKLLPRVLWMKDWYDSVDWCQQQMEERLSRESRSDLLDLTFFLMEKGTDAGVSPWLRGDSLLAILAGSEPTAQALAAIFHELVMHPEHIDKLHKELGDTCITNNEALAELPHLNAVIQEAMRLHPSLITGGIRKTTENGVTIRDVYIPPHITVVTPLYTISRREDCFERGTEFIPERWTTRPGMVRNAAAHVPFSLGKYNCIGQHLAMRIMRYTLARVIKEYNFCHPPGVDGHEMEADKVDRFTSFPGKVPLLFKPRERVGRSAKTHVAQVQ